MGLLFGLFTSLCIGLAELTGRRVLQVSTAVTVAVIIQVTATCGALGVALVDGGVFRVSDLLLGGLSGFGFAGGLLGYFEGLRRTTSAVVAPVSASLATLGPYLASLALGADPSALAVGGAIVALIGVLLVSSAGGRGRGALRAFSTRPLAGSAGNGRRLVAQNEARSGLSWSVFSGLSYAVGLSVLLVVSDDAGSWPAVSQRFIAAVAMALIALRAADPLLPPLGLRAMGVASGVLAAGSSIFFLLGAAIDQPSAIIGGSVFPAVSVVLGRSFYGDTVTPRQWAGLIVVLAGVLAVVGG